MENYFHPTIFPREIHENDRERLPIVDWNQILEKFFDSNQNAYANIFKRCGIKMDGKRR